VKIYLKTRSGKWMIINRKLEHVVIRGKKKSTRYILAGETTDPPSYTTTTIRELELPATHVTKLISALLDKKREKLVVVIEPKSSTLYSVKVTEGDAGTIDAIVEEITAKSKKKTSAKTSEESRE
jgi:hypothetical protein